MNSIRPLITIAILVVVGAFLYVKINEGPVRPVPDASEAWPNQSPEGVPPLAATSETPSQSISPAPPWSASPPATALASEATTNIAVAAQQPPAVPAIPAMPDVVPPPQPAGPITTSIPLPAGLPANIPTARYPDESASLAAPSDAAPAIAAPPIAVVPIPAAPVSQSQVPAQELLSPQQPESIGLAATGLNSVPSTTQQNPLRESPPPSAGERYTPGTGLAELANVDTPAAAMQSSFAASWPTIQAALDRGELARAHQLLSQWHHDPTLTPTDAEMVDALLSQLAGTVVYSTEHQLEPARVVKPGDSLETIAKEFNVPWQLLAKINGIPAAEQVQPGQELKVVRGPFSAVVDLDRKQLTLMVDGRYAGTFPVTVPSLAAVSEGNWLVDQKVLLPSAGVAQSAYAPTPAAVDRAIVLRGEPTQGQASSGATLTIASGGAPAGATAGSPAIRISPQDAEELSDILSIGSRVVIQR